MKFYFKIFFIALPILVALDVSWVGVIANSFYKTTVGDLMATTPNYYGAIAFYLIYTVGLLYFALLPALRERSFVLAFIRAGVLGFVTYGVYNVTNTAVLTHWSYIVCVVDTAWGVVVSSVTAGLTYLLATKLYGLEENESLTPKEQVLI